jgi:cyanate permease
MTIVRGTIVPELFGPRDYATINGALALPFNLSRALAPGIAAALWRISGGYDGVTLALFAALSAAFVAIWVVTIRK